MTQIVINTFPTNLTKAQLRKLTKVALKRLYSPSTARRLWELHRMGVSIGTLARARKVLDGFRVTPENDHEWSFFTDCEQPITKPLALELWHENSGTFIMVVSLGLPPMDRLITMG